MTTRSASPADPPPRSEGAGLVFWYQATGLSRASASCRYRLAHFAEFLRGATCVVDPKPPASAFEGARMVVVVRPFADDALRARLAALRDGGVRLVADFDDLLFEGEPADYPLVQAGRLSAADWTRRVAGYQAGLALFDAFTAATTPLVEALGDREVGWVPNGLSRRWVEQGRALYPRWRPGDPKVIRLLAGSPSHDADLATVAPALRSFMEANPEVSLELVGPVAPRGLQATTMPRRDYEHLPELLASSWATIAPLQDSAFTRCKSAIKFLESAAFGAPCIASPLADAERHEGGGILIASDEGQWWRALSSLLDDEERLRRSEQGMGYVDRCGMADRGAATLSAWLRRVA